MRRVARLTALAAVTLSVIPAAASAACSTAATTQAFARFGDPNYYYLTTGGGFEGPIAWTTTGAVSLSGVTDPFDLSGKRDEDSARLKFAATLRTAKLCVSRDEPYLRFIAKSAPAGSLDVTVNVYDSSGNKTNSSGGGVSPSDHQAWAPSRLIDLKTKTSRSARTATWTSSSRARATG